MNKLSEKSEAMEVLEYFRSLVWKEIQPYLKSPQYPYQFEISDKYSDIENFHWELVSEYPHRMGKYVRPTLLMLTALAMGQEEKNILKAAAAMQTSEEWILISDDIEDKSELRRGKPTLHKQYGVELAINASDTLQTIMWKIMFDNLYILGESKTKELVDEFYKILIRTELGQTAEIKWFTENKLDFKDEDWYFIGASKSGYYSIAGPIRLGAIIAGASREQIEALTKFGIELGYCWQLVDDLLDLTSDFQGLKQKANDIFEGKRTLMLSHLLVNVNKEGKVKLLKILEKTRSQKSDLEVEWVINLMKKYGSIDYGWKLAEKHKNNCINIFEEELDFLKTEPYRSNLKTLTNFILERKH